MSPLLALSRHRQSSAECLLFGENWTYPDKTNLDRAEPVETGSAPQIVRFARPFSDCLQCEIGKGEYGRRYPWDDRRTKLRRRIVRIERR
jgi:hypothetical protein